MNLLFYSKKCSTSINLIKLLHNENMLGYFKLCCVDDKLDKLPSQITRVPTLIVKNIAKPLVASEAFEYIAKIKFIKNQPNQDQNNDKPKETLKSPLGYLESEMTGISDTFAYKDVDKPLPHCYFNLGDEEKHIIFTAPESNKILQEEQSKKIKMLQVQREHQEKEYSELMKQQQQYQLNKMK